MTSEPTIKKSPRSQITNAAFGGPGGGTGEGDRGANQILSRNSGNPYDNQDYVSRWRAYCGMYEKSWEARKIIRIIPEDALRKPWAAEDIPEEMAVYAQTKLDRLQFTGDSTR